ncbi:MAG: LysR family transcriptional regulator [Nannocystaceae bacterium]|nr:LysR family transcriptional regulator [Nannocystaceae bacterium]
MQTMRWNDLRILLAVFREGSLKRASASLDINISTASRRVDALEALVGARLFDRTPDGTKPTDAAERLVAHAEAMERGAMGFLRAAEGLEVEPEGVVRLAAPPGVADHFLVPQLASLIERHPKVRLQILAGIGYADLSRREADLALRLRRPTGGDFTVRRIANDGYIAITSADTPARRTVSDASQCRWVTWGEDLGGRADRAWVFDHAGADAVVLETSSMTAQIEAVRMGFASMLVPLPYVTVRGVKRLKLSKALEASLRSIPPDPLWLVGHRALREVPRIAAVWDWLVERMSFVDAAGR